METNCLADDTTIYRKDGVIRPTKLGQCLCFLYGGGTVPERIEGNEQGSEMLATLYYYLAKSMTCARNRLQKIKHSDVGGDEEKREIEEARLAILGVVEIAHRFCWVYKGELPHCFKPANRIDSGRSQSPALPDGSISPSRSSLRTIISTLLAYMLLSRRWMGRSRRVWAVLAWRGSGERGSCRVRAIISDICSIHVVGRCLKCAFPVKLRQRGRIALGLRRAPVLADVRFSPIAARV